MTSYSSLNVSNTQSPASGIKDEFQSTSQFTNSNSYTSGVSTTVFSQKFNCINNSANALILVNFSFDLNSTSTAMIWHLQIDGLDIVAPSSPGSRIPLTFGVAHSSGIADILDGTSFAIVAEGLSAGTHSLTISMYTFATATFYLNRYVTEAANTTARTSTNIIIIEC